MSWFDILKASPRGKKKHGMKRRLTGRQEEHRLTAGTHYTQIHEFLEVMFDLNMITTLGPIGELTSGQRKGLSNMLGMRGNFLEYLSEEQFNSFAVHFNEDRIKEGLDVLIELAKAHKLNVIRWTAAGQSERNKKWLANATPEQIAERKRKKAEYDKIYRRPSRRKEE